jgi:hypothetical protein
MILELKDGTVKNFHYAVAAKLLKRGDAEIYEGEREKVEVKSVPKVRKTRKRK